MFSIFLIQLPTVVVWLVGIVLALFYSRKYPRVSLLALISLVGFLFLALINTYLNATLPVLLRDQGMTAQEIGASLATQGVINSLISALLWGLLLAAIFGWRR